MDLLDALDQEWQTLPHRRQNRSTYNTWRTTDPVLDEYSDLGALLEAAKTEPPYKTDRILAALAARSPRDTLAARSLLQAMLPGLRRLVIAHHWLAPRVDLDAAVVAVAWDRIRNYPIDRRPRRIAANLILDTGHHLRRHFPRTVATIPLDELKGTPAPGPERHDLIEALDDLVASEQIGPEQAEIIIRTRHLDEPVIDLARRLGCTPRALLERRRRAEASLRAAG